MPGATPGADPSRWDRFGLDFADGGRLVLRDKRRLGRVRLEPDLGGVGPDAAEIRRAGFGARVGRGVVPVKARIMDQSVLAGVGNLLADEALWRARQDPRQAAGTLTEEQLDRLWRAIRAATRDAIRLGGVHTGKLIPHRVLGAAARAAARRWSAPRSVAAPPGGAAASRPDRRRYVRARRVRLRSSWRSMTFAMSLRYWSTPLTFRRPS